MENKYEPRQDATHAPSWWNWRTWNIEKQCWHDNHYETSEKLIQNHIDQIVSGKWCNAPALRATVEKMRADAAKMLANGAGDASVGLYQQANELEACIAIDEV